MDQNLENAMALLARTPAALEALLSGLPEMWTHQNEGKDSWNACDIVGHLIYTERVDWMPRANTILKFGETQTFEPFDRQGHRRDAPGKSLPQLLGEFAWLRSENLDALRAMNLKPEDLARRGKHPALGAVTLGELLSTWAAHDLTHLHQLARVMAYQYRDKVGPFQQYLGVMQCDGHSAP